MSKNFTIEINCDNEKTKGVVASFFNEFKSNIRPLLSALFKRDGDESDPSIIVDGDAVTVEQFASDKGLVLVESKDSYVEVIDYKDLSEGTTYLTKEQDKMAVFVKSAEGADIPVGHFLELDAALRHINSEEVAEQVTKRLAERSEKEVPVENAVYIDDNGEEVD